MLDIIVDERHGLVLPDYETVDFCNKLVKKYCNDGCTSTVIVGSELMISAIRVAMLENNSDHTQVQFRNIKNLDKITTMCEGYSPKCFGFIDDTTCQLLMKLI